MKRRIIILCMALVLLAVNHIGMAQADLAAKLNVTAAGVQVQRVGTTQPISIGIETIIGVGDLIFTNDEGEAMVTFVDGITTTLLPDTQYRVDQFQGSGDTFELSVSVLVGRTVQAINRPLNEQSSYSVNTPGMRLGARGTAFEIRVEDNGRSGMVVNEGLVAASNEAQTSDVSVPPGFGVRADVGGTISDVVSAENFAQLDSALDGCAISMSTPDDLSMNVRTSPNTDSPRVGVVAANNINRAYGTVADGAWYRIAFADHFGWVLSSNAQISGHCAGLRIFEPDFNENVRLYNLSQDRFGLVDESVQASAEPTDSE